MSVNKEIMYRPHHPSSSLCSVCAQLDFSPSAYTPGISKLTPRERERIGKTSTCPFCRIAKSGNRGPIKWSSKRGFDTGNPELVSPYDSKRWVFVDEHAERSAPLSGRIMNPQADIGLLKNWLRLCEEVHGDQCAPNPDVVFTPQSPLGRLGLKAFRVIDVHEMCVVDAQVGCRYLALSYSWGQVPSPCLLANNKKQLMTAHALEPLHGQLPRTLRDAIDLVKLMGERYIWIDRLCLIQDDPKDMQHGIQKMDLVYEGSILCIIAAAGRDGGAGLPGVHSGSRNVKQRIEEIEQGLKLVEVGNLYQDLGGVYMTRGWTYQELMLPPRSLIILESRIYYRCSRVVWSEDTAYDRAPLVTHKNTGASSNIPVFRDKNMTPYFLYTMLILRYSAREFTKEGDALDAITGLVSRIARELRSNITQGLLNTHFDLCLLFYHPWSLPVERRVEFPSWAWVGWKGYAGTWDPNSDKQSVDDWLATKRHIKWYQRNLQTGEVKLICEPGKSQAKNIIPDRARGIRTHGTGDETALARPQDKEKKDDSEDDNEVRDGYEEKGGDNNEGSGEADEEESGEEGDDDEWEDCEEDDDEGEDDEGDDDEGDDDEGEVDEGEVDEGEVDEGEDDEGEVDEGEDDEGGDDEGEDDEGEDEEEKGEEEKEEEMGDGEKSGDEEGDEDEGSDDEETQGGLRTEPTDIPWKSIPYKYTALQFWTWTVLIPSLEVTGPTQGKIYSEKGLCGAVSFDDRQYDWGKVKHCEAVLLSKSDRCASLGLEVPAGEPIYFVILIDWKGFYAERKAVGFIYRSHIKYLVPLGESGRK